MYFFRSTKPQAQEQEQQSEHDEVSEKFEEEYAPEEAQPLVDEGTTKGGYTTEQSDGSGSNESEQVILIDDAIERVGNGHFQMKLLFASGLCFAADAMEMIILSFLSIVVQAEWDLSTTETASISSAVFIGALVGTLTLGPLADMIGRKPVFTITASIIALFGFATAMASNLETFIICRFLVGFGVGGFTIPFDTLAEFVPDANRGRTLYIIEYFWAMGPVFVPLVAMFTLDGTVASSWRSFVFWCAVPCLVSTILGIIVVPESPRWLLTRGRVEEAMDIMRSIAIQNGKDPDALFPPGSKLVTHYQQESLSDNSDGEKMTTDPICDVVAVAEENHNFLELLSPKWRNINLTLWGTWAGYTFIYYGTIIVVTLVFASSSEDDDHVSNSSGAGNNSTATSDVDDSAYSFDYGAIFASASSEMAGNTLGVLFVDRFGRVPTQSYSYMLGGISALLLCLLAQFDVNNGIDDFDGNDNDNESGFSFGLKLILAFCARMFFMLGMCATWISTAEILVTEIRTTGHSAANAVARISGAICPFLVSSSQSYGTIGVTIFIISMGTSFISRRVPETKGIAMGSLQLDGVGGIVAVVAGDGTMT